MSELPAAQRNAVERAYFGGLTYVQIGRALRIPATA